MKKYPEKKICDIAETTSGGTPSRSMSQYYGGNIPWIKSGELNDGLISEHSEAITEEALKNSSAKIYPKGTLVLALYGATVGKVGIVNFATASNQAVCAIFPSREVDKKYLFWFLRQKRLDFIRISFGGAQPNISQTVVKKTLLPVPPLSIQNQVVTILDEYETSKNLIETEVVSEIKDDLHKYNIIKTGYDKIVENNSTNLELCEKLLQAILQEAVSGKLVPQNPSDEPASELMKRIKVQKEKLVKEGKIRKDNVPKPISKEEVTRELPEGWEWERLGEIVQFNPRNYLDNSLEVSFVPMKLIEDGYKNEHSFEIKKWSEIKSGFTHFQERDIVFAKITPCFENRKSAIMSNLMNRYGAGTTELIVMRTFDELVLPEFLLLLVKTDDFIKLGVSSFTGTAGQQRVKSEIFQNLVIGLPPLPEQKHIVQKVDHLTNLCGELENKVKKNQENSELLMEAVLKEAFAS